jgi:HAE1 family hydrophobic/amphiphilic exporter-1
VQQLAEICVHRPIFATVLVLGLVVVGGVSYQNLAVDRFPSIDTPMVRTTVRLPGASPEEMETQVGQILEETINTVEGIDELRTISGQGVCHVIAWFKLERNLDAAAQDVRDRVAIVVDDLPREADPPVVSKFDNDSSPVLTIALSGPRTLRELTDIAERVVKRQLERASGVGEVSLVGGLERSINIELDADKLAAFGLSAATVRDAIARQNSDIPGGNLSDPQSEQVLRTMGRVTDPAQFADIVIETRGGSPILVRDVATVEDSHVEQRTLARLDGDPTVTLRVRRQSGANTVLVIEGVKKILEELPAQLPADVSTEIILDQSRYIYAALHEINMHLVMGSILASLVVLLFMRSWRATIIAAVAIPTSLVATFAVMWALDFTLNSVTMLGLVLMVGIVIDDAIVVLENIYRFIDEKGVPPLRAAVEATREIGLAVLATTLSLVVIFVPVSFMSSISGRFLYQFGITAAAAILVSLLVSFTLTPMMCSRMLRPGMMAGHGEKQGINAWLDRAYSWMLRGCLRHRAACTVVGLLVIASSVPLYKMVRMEFIPGRVDEAEFEVNVSAPEETSFLAMNEIMKDVEARIRDVRGVQLVLTEVGGGFISGVNSGECYVRIVPHEERVFSLGRLWRSTLAGDPAAAWRDTYSQQDVMQEIRRKLAGMGGLRTSVRNMQSFNFGGTRFEIDFVIRGPDLQQLHDYAETLRLKTPELGGIVDADITLKLDKPELRVFVDRAAAADLGVDTADVAGTLRLLVGGDDEVSRFHDPSVNEDYDIRLRLQPSDRMLADRLFELYVPSRTRGLVRLDSVARLEPAQSASRIDRSNRQRQASVRASVGPGYALADRIEALQAAADDLNMPETYTTAVSGRAKEMARTYNEFILAFALSIVFMYMILAAQYESLVHPLTILLSLPLCMPFALLSLWATGDTLNLYSALGVLVLFGVVKKNAILQIDHINQLRRRGEERHIAVMHGCRDRLRPILMTTLSFVMGMLPLAIGTGPGAEERRTISVVVIGGQTLALLLTLLLTPVAYTLLDDGLAWVRRALGRAEAPATVAEPEVAAP